MAGFSVFQQRFDLAAGEIIKQDLQDQQNEIHRPAPRKEDEAGDQQDRVPAGHRQQIIKKQAHRQEHKREQKVGKCHHAFPPLCACANTRTAASLSALIRNSTSSPCTLTALPFWQSAYCSGA